MENEKSKYCLTDYSERLANLIKDQVQVSNCLREALKIEDSVLDEIIFSMKDLFLEMIGVEQEEEESFRDNIENNFFNFLEGEITLDEFMRLANGQAE